MNENPYQTPETIDGPPSPADDAESTRREHIKTEASIKSIGLLYWLAAVAIIISAIPLITGSRDNGSATALQIAIGVGLIALGILQFIVGLEIRRLKNWARIAVGILSGIGLLGFPIGTLVNAYILFLIFGKKGQMVFSPAYKEIIAATPHVKYKTSKWILIILIVFLVVFAGILIATFAGLK